MKISEKTKKFWLVFVNVFLMSLIIAFVIVYSSIEGINAYNIQLQNFEATSSTIERITENYLDSEQHICNTWATYINSQKFKMEEAVGYLRSTIALQNTSAHLINVETLEGVSAREKVDDPGNYNVSYSDELFGDISWISSEIGPLNVSKVFTNPMNHKQSLAFCNRINLVADDGVTLEDSLILRLIPISDLTQKWIFPDESFADIEISVIDENGDFIAKGESFIKTNFFDCYREFNPNSTINNLSDIVKASNGSINMLNSKGQSAIVVHVPILKTGSRWVLLSYIPEASLKSTNQNWLLIGIVVGSLLALAVIDFVYLFRVNKTLVAVSKQADAANKAKTDFLSSMSHDIRTPMNAIIGLTTLSEKNIDDKEVVSENLRKISMASNHLLTLVNDILDISKVESGKLNLNPLNFSIVETVENLVNISHPMINEKGLDFSFHIGELDIEYLYADQLRLNQIYINILSNAIKYTEPGGKVSVDLFESKSEKENHVKLTYIVSDTGIGMSKEFMEKMYQPFSRETDSRVNSIQGTGLGLAITLKMVNLMHGKIECDSELGKGTTFKIILDLPIADRQLDDMNLGPINVLVVDDDEILLTTAVSTLETLGAHAYKASSGNEAIELIKKQKESEKQFDVVIVDWKMKEMDGIQTIKEIRRHFDKNIPILLVSAYDWSEIESDAKEAGANGFITKPLFKSTLYKKISDLLGVENNVIEPVDDYSDLKGMNILIAEDNDINWEIISAMVSMFGIKATRAENGQVCVDLAKNSKEGEYSLIFMDIQMPIMNGLDATREIRKLENSWVKDIPIIAMTADAFAENVTECLNAGMNGHIAKPIDMKLVIKEIRKIKEAEKYSKK